MKFWLLSLLQFTSWFPILQTLLKHAMDVIIWLDISILNCLWFTSHFELYFHPVHSLELHCFHPSLPWLSLLTTPVQHLHISRTTCGIIFPSFCKLIYFIQSRSNVNITFKKTFLLQIKISFHSLYMHNVWWSSEPWK